MANIDSDSLPLPEDREALRVFPVGNGQRPVTGLPEDLRPNSA